MPRSSRHKSHKQSKHSSKDYSDSDEDVTKMKDKSNKDDISTRVRRDSASGEKRKFSEVPEGTNPKDLAGDGCSEIVEVYGSSRLRKEEERTDASVGRDRWGGDGDDRGVGDRNVEKANHKLDSLKGGSKLKENSSKGEGLRNDSKSKSKRYQGGSDERKEDSLGSLTGEKEEGKSRGESKRRSERDAVTHKERKELKDMGRNGDGESKIGDGDMNVRNKQAHIGDLSEERQGKRSREIAEQTLQDEFCSTELEKDGEKRIRRKRERSGEREKHCSDSRERDERQLSSRHDRTKDLKCRDNKHKDGVCEDKYLEDGDKDERQQDEKYQEEAGKDGKYHDDKYQDGDKSSRRKSDRHRDDGDKYGRRKDEKHHDDGERDRRQKDDRYREGVEREGRRDEKYREDGDRDRRPKDGRYHEDGDKDIRRRDERYRDGGDRDDRHRDSSYRDGGDRDSRPKEGKYREDTERDSKHKDSKQMDERDREKRPRDPKGRDERTSRDRSSNKSDHKHAKDDDYAADHHSLKSSAYDNSPIHDDRTVKYRRTNEKEDYGDNGYRGTKTQRSDTERINSSGAITEVTTNRTRVQKQDETRYGDCNHEERTRHIMSTTIDHTSTYGGSEKSSLSLENLKKDGHLGEPSAERRIRSSPSKLVDKSPSSGIDRRQFSRPDVRRTVDFEESTQRSGGSRNWKEYSGKEGRGNRELNMDVLPGEESSQADADTLSVSSPFMRNSHYPNSSILLGPHPFRTGLGSPSLSGSAEDEGRSKSNIHDRRTGDPSMGRIQGSPWGSVPGWPSPVANGFMPFPPHVSFTSVMQPFPAPPMFGVRPSMEFDHPTPYHMPDSDRFPSPMRPMGWGHQIDNSGGPLHSWDASNAVFRNESHVYGRSDWDHSRNLIGYRGPNRTGSMEMPNSEKENDSTRSGEILSDSSGQPALPNQLTESKEVDQLIKSSKKNDDEALFTSLEDRTDAAKSSRNDDIPLCGAYLSRLDISADLTEPELLNECTGLIDVNPSIFCNVNEYKILCMEDEEAKMTASHGVLSNTLFAYTDDSVFQKSMSLYKRQKEMFLAEDDEKLKLSINFIPNSNQEDLHAVDDKTGTKDSVQELPENTYHKKADTTETPKEAVSAEDINADSKLIFNIGQQDLDAEKPLSAASVEGSDPPPYQVKDAQAKETATAHNTEEVKLVDAKCGSILNSEMLSEAMLGESMMSGSDNLSRIHLSPESTH